MKTVGRIAISTCGRIWNAVIGSVTVTLIVLVLQPLASGGFIGDYSPDRFTLTNANADGWFEVVPGGSVLQLYGGNEGTGLAGTTDLVVTAALGGLFGFRYAYASVDLAGYDLAGYLVNGVFTALADTDGQSGEVKLPLLAGDLFGFRIVTADNLGEPGVLIIDRFTAPGSPATVTPEGSTVWLLLGGGVLLARRRRSC